MVQITGNRRLTSFILAWLVLFGCAGHRAQLSSQTQKLLREISLQNEATPRDGMLVLSQATQKAFMVGRSPQGYFVHASLRISDNDIEPALTKRGVTVNSRVNDIWTATIPIAALADLSQTKGVDAIEIDMPVRQR